MSIESRESIVNMSRGVRNGVDANTASHDEQAMKDRVLLPGSGKKINDPKSSRQGIAVSLPIMKQISVYSSESS